ncbi:DNA-binding transcriptional LysR family regulator [Actinoplanes campanulatus]|uniref:DNA-binding transcriptional LysR family regulator n=1 Tax=Actinoplanes campanulatus TaxID=113559 RepID=A0A7W5AD38_9ACTN|nr:LysR family transcriptional regulator [Actinoplanes campanulatus]MBB3093978.1 DNA-binding transcriptional LysR family regulator [Actinoplanes campanulatus]GGN33464.1 LysR family transcriptional regulator [Actinoplanes campanulatus]GID38326.1 LysR family transcriptional regulator [Actinoplanes campanulatus]
MTYTLEQLRGLVAVAEELHFGRAAARLRMTQPPLSRQIQKLEAAVGAQLLERDTRRVTLTPAGHAFLAEARRILSIAEAAPALAQRVSSGFRGLVRMAFTSASTFGILGRLLNELEARLPEVHLELYEMVTREQIDALTGEDIDLGLARPPFDPELFESRLLHREALLLAVHEDHPLAGLDRAVVPADLATEPLIFHSQRKARYFYDLVVSMVPLAQERVVHTVSQVMTMLWLVSAGRGVAFVPASARLVGVPGVAFLPIATPIAEPVELHLLWPRRSHNPALARVLDALEHVML